MRRLIFNNIWIILLITFSYHSFAQEYKTPAKALQQTVENNTTVVTRLSNNHEWMAILTPISAPAISTFATAEQKLAGLRISPQQLIPSRLPTRYNQLKLINIKNNEQRTINLPNANDITEVTFSPNNRYLSFVSLNQSGGYLYAYDIEKDLNRQLTNQRLNGSINLNYQWLGECGVVARFANEQNGQWRQSQASYSPMVKETLSSKTQQRTYQDLLKNSADEQRFTDLTMSQLALVKLDGTISTIAKAQIFLDFSISPDEKYILATHLTPPFSYKVKYHDFPKLTAVYRLNDAHITTIHQSLSGEQRPTGSDAVLSGPRMIQWVQGQAATLAFTQALDLSDSRQAAAKRDSLWTLSAPFTDKAKLIGNTQWRIVDIEWAEHDLVLVTERNTKLQRLRMGHIDLNQEKTSLHTFSERNMRDKYQDLGQFFKVYIPNKGKLIHISQHANSPELMHYGQGASNTGNRPFLKHTLLVNGTSTLLWQSANDKLESVRYILDVNPLRMIINRESPNQAPSLVLINVNDASETVLYQQPEGLQAYKGIQKQLITYQRADGVPLSGTLYLPAGYRKEQGPLPVLMWAYPREFNDAEIAGQVSFSPNQYLKISPKGPVPFVAEGFAVFDKVSMPIIGQNDKAPNDNFKQQLTANAQAAVDVLVNLGIADPKRIAIGGHSYGAFMVANLLAHTDLFYAGIARSGAYNRSLTPFGFQNEERNYWQANDIYQQMSPFNYANQIKSPLLLIHGEMDQNSGTFPMQAERMFDAIKGLGGTARLVILPFESHSYSAKESLNHMLWEQSHFLKAHMLATH